MTFGSMPGATHMPRAARRLRASTVAGRRRPAESLLLVMLVTASIGVMFLYQDLMNLVSDDFRLAMAGAMAAGLLSLAAIMLPFRMSRWGLLIIASLVGLILCWGLAIANGQAEYDLKPMVYALLPLAFAPWIIEYRNAIEQRWMVIFVLATIVFAGIWSATSPFVQQGLVLRVQPFSGTLDQGAHPSSYYLAVCVLILHIVMVRRQLPAKLGWPAIAVAVAVMLALRVATPLLALIYYGGAFILLHKRASLSMRATVVICGLLGVVVVLQLHSLWVGDPGVADMPIEELGSGRVGTWIGRAQYIMNRDLALNLFGSGPGTDFLFSPIWWWRKLQSHSDVLTTIIEDGFLGLVCVMVALVLIFARFGLSTLPLAVFFATVSLIDVGLMERPVQFMLYWVAFAMAFADQPAVRADRPRTRLAAVDMRHAVVRTRVTALAMSSGAIADQSRDAGANHPRDR